MILDVVRVLLGVCALVVLGYSFRYLRGDHEPERTVRAKRAVLVASGLSVSLLVLAIVGFAIDAIGPIYMRVAFLLVAICAGLAAKVNL